MRTKKFIGYFGAILAKFILTQSIIAKPALYSTAAKFLLKRIEEPKFNYIIFYAPIAKKAHTPNMGTQYLHWFDFAPLRPIVMQKMNPASPFGALTLQAISSFDRLIDAIFQVKIQIIYN